MNESATIRIAAHNGSLSAPKFAQPKPSNADRRVMYCANR